MRPLVDKLKTIELAISKEKGKFALFALFVRPHVQNVWDLVVSAPWIGKQKKETLNYILEKIDPKDLMAISRVVILEPTDPFVQMVNNFIATEHSSGEFQNCTFNNVFIEHAFIVTSQRV